MNEIIQHHLEKLLTLVSSPQIRFDENSHATLPTIGGVYRIFESGADWSSSLYVGKTGDLRDRI